MSKTIEDRICTFCESQYKLSYDPEDTSGFGKCCPFCGEEYTENQDDYYDDEDSGC